jgi:hypothetical protein
MLNYLGPSMSNYDQPLTKKFKVDECMIEDLAKPLGPTTGFPT